jgi:hypothetical protein
VFGSNPQEFQQSIANFTPDQRAHYATPESVAALLVASQEDRFASVENVKLEVADGTPMLGITATMLDESGNRMTKPFLLMPSETGWHVMVPISAVRDFMKGQQHKGPFLFWYQQRPAPRPSP